MRNFNYTSVVSWIESYIRVGFWLKVGSQPVEKLLGSLRDGSKDLK